MAIEDNIKISCLGAVGFIGSSILIQYPDRGDEMIGIDHHNNSYDPVIKGVGLAPYVAMPALICVSPTLVSGLFSILFILIRLYSSRIRI
jgi:nucleoside-diphosphate-sugar epimerase